MAPGRRTFSGGFVILLSVLLLGVTVADAADVTLTVTDSIGTSSYDNDGVNNWSDTLDPSAGNDYFVAVEWLRTPGSGDHVFAGDSLTLQTGGGIINKNGGAQTITTNLILDGGLVRSGSGVDDTFTLAGSIDVTSTGALVPDQSPYVVSADITGAGTLYLLNDASDYGFSGASGPGRGIDIAGDSTLTGDVVADALDMVWTDTSSWSFIIGASGVNNKIAGTGDATFDGLFTFDLTGATSTPGDNWTIIDVATQTFGSTFTVGGGFSQSGSVWTDGTYTFNPNTGILAVAAPPNEWGVDADGNWSVGTNWTEGSAPATDGDALLGPVITESRTVTLDANVQLNSIAFNNTPNGGDYFVAPQTAETLTLTGEAKVDVQAGRHWIRADVAGTVGLNTTGSGELVLDATNSFSGGLSVDDTNVAIVNTGALPAGSDITIQNGGQVQFWGADNAFFTGEGAAGYGTGTVSGTVSIDGTSTLYVNDGADVTFSGAITGDGGVTLDGSASGGIATFSVANSYNGITQLSGSSSLTLDRLGHPRGLRRYRCHADGY